MSEVASVWLEACYFEPPQLWQKVYTYIFEKKLYINIPAWPCLCANALWKRACGEYQVSRECLLGQLVPVEGSCMRRLPIPIRFLRAFKPRPGWALNPVPCPYDSRVIGIYLCIYIPGISPELVGNQTLINCHENRTCLRYRQAAPRTDARSLDCEMQWT